MFLIDLNYLIPLEEAAKYRNFIAIALQKNLLLLAGIKNLRHGGILITLHDNLLNAEDFIKQGPFITNNIAECKITEFIPTKYSTDMQHILEKMQENNNA
ncbi:GTP cyclohydrolase [Rickettsiales endosymbiont of Stachyamoeba lipophora]|uniref:GTP cyclohydrolase n=1 Tax=Rickettsiales endosymbiont of Stachyamoeba lipophora TaxID=2486578 RepID=UPI000F654EAA|nr:GTP cyclohydrolase [Rickettsiales endosymbiont of Stachyamoeba lipophora]AZL16004.1 GTP cyclohydrolase [Rickettsiales endosymbiont of Stachyamoeba lipophora]